MNNFLRSGAVTETFWATQKKRSHMKGNLYNTFSDDVTFTTIRGGSSSGLQVTKRRRLWRWAPGAGEWRVHALSSPS